MAVRTTAPLTIFGAEKGWHPKDWTASDDRVRGGSSQSYLECNKHIGRFYGTLDTKTLGGAGFASQRTTGDDREWDLSDYAGIQLIVAKGDKKRYTFILKDTLLPRSDDGREQSTVSWEIDFELPPQTIPGETEDKSIYFPWDALNPTYRGRVKKDAEPLDLKKIKRMSIMMRSFFDAQSGDFSLSIKSVKALKHAPKNGNDEYLSLENADTVNADPRSLEEGSGQIDEKASFISEQDPAPLRSPRTIFHSTKAVVVGVLVVLTAVYYLARHTCVI